MDFGVPYGQSASTFQEKHDVPEREAQQFIDWWWMNFKGVAAWKKRLIADMRKVGYVQSPFGRKRRFHLITPENKGAIFREAFNFVPQSTAGDFTLLSVIKLRKEIDLKKAVIVITVHDNIVGDVKESYVDEYSKICDQVMVSRPMEELGWQIPFKVDIGSGPNWADTK
jgi:DNA polymerase-1